MLICDHVSLSYQKDHPVLSNINLELEPGSFHFLTGASGAGKTSLLGLLSLTLRATGGHISMFGKDVTRLKREHLPRLRRRIGTVTQDFRLLDHLTVAENIAMPLKVVGESTGKIDAKVRELLSWVGLREYHDSMPETLSGGQKQRVAIARAVITKPEILLADEPTGNLDPQLALRFMYLFEALNQAGTTVLIATHDEHLISQFDYEVLRLKEGRLS